MVARTNFSTNVEKFAFAGCTGADLSSGAVAGMLMFGISTA
jgi:hypothetical protein